ncbi:hypothetical protein D3C81_1826320 [compost metagenome]
MADADPALADLRVIGIEIHPHLACATRLDGRDVRLRSGGFQDGVVAGSVAYLHQALGRQADFHLTHLRITAVAQFDEQASTVVDQPCLEGFGE